MDRQVWGCALDSEQDMPARVLLVPPPRQPEQHALYYRVKQEVHATYPNPAFPDGYPARATVRRGLQYRLSAQTSALNLGWYFERVIYPACNGTMCNSFRYVSPALSGTQMGDIRWSIERINETGKTQNPYARTTGGIGECLFADRAIALPSLPAPQAALSISVPVAARTLFSAPAVLAA
ncbi:hypothetical protein K488DRAFT_88411 [Vararia minispora EC-137]|uniref:Uncharacterized protein n=1 Tax=Vararia minispora EC-137 TaxID=1314806 RepID=A0ACB8QD60_9AGAM|nr:hypothetical protein K488DRAFT_88411 [Vararia minispora EC-137]